jgi:hypothetical protein
VVSQDCIGWPVACCGEFWWLYPPPLPVGDCGVVGAVVGAVGAWAWLSAGLPLGGAAIVTAGVIAIDPAAIRRLMVRFIGDILSGCSPCRTPGCASSDALGR